MSNAQPGRRALRVHLRWTPAREERALRRLTRARERRNWPRFWPRVVAFSLAAACVAVLVVVTRARKPEVPIAGAPLERLAPSAPLATVPRPSPAPVVVPVAPPAVAETAPERLVRFRDGSTAFLATAATELKLLLAQDQRIVSELLTGAARFEVTKRPSRVFRVLAGTTSVEVLGTTFELDRQGPRLGVRVLEGRVRVTWVGGTRQLGQGEEGLFPPEAPAAGEARLAHLDRQKERSARTQRPPTTGAPETVGAAAAVEAVASPSTDATVGSDPVTLAAKAPSEVARPPNNPPAQPPRNDDNLAIILRRADEARAGGRSVDAATALREATSQGAGDPRVSLAEFRLGRLLLEDLSQPREAAGAFARARALAPNGPLASDALAREVEARAVGGENERARTLAREYLTRYPKGTHAAWVRRWGGLD